MAWSMPDASHWQVLEDFVSSHDDGGPRPADEELVDAVRAVVAGRRELQSVLAESRRTLSLVRGG